MKKEKQKKVEKKIKKEKKRIAKEKKSIIKKNKKMKTPEHKPVKIKRVKLPRKQKARFDKKVKLEVKNRQTKWAPVWVVPKKFGNGKKIHPSRMTKHRRSWRRTKLHIKPRKIRKWHMG